ncbi:hypothetical protein M8C21_020508 [Ambrosia artemisiifolia]|uniref:Protein CHROMATIN REMODELING 4 n=1 Tax=Ambrosia artemisiifolia TaxID=4212 RepID=A0AAD5CZ92_AMBAR|nr:hypothetical protein M8C21_020508 [Ambrosia artemisiifolia]
MKNNETSASDVINGNWTLKRKRKKIGAAKSNGKKNESTPSDSHTSTSSKCKIKEESSSDRSPSKKKRKDGSYHECVICDLGGDLLFCDGCSKTYHIACLDPPLKQRPSDTWQCPSCCSESNVVEAVDKVESTSKRARTKVTVGKPKSKDKSAKTDKVSRILRNTNLGTKKSTRKTKSLFASPKGDGSPERSSSFSDHHNEKQTDLGEKEVIKNKKKRDRDQSKETATGKSEKKRKNISSEDVQKRNRTDSARKRDKVSLEVNETSKSQQQKHKSVKHAKTKSLSKSGMGSKNSDIRSKDKKKIGAKPSESQEEEKDVELLKNSDKTQQVDRVLGCRIQVTEKQSAVSVIEADKSDNTNGEPEKNTTIFSIRDVVNECTEGNATGSTGKPTSDPNSLETDERDKDDSALKSNDLTKPCKEIVNGDSTDVIIDDTKTDLEKSANCSKSLSNNEKTTVSYEFLVKWVGKSNLHNTWVSESQLKILAKRKLDNYKGKYGTMVINICEERWKVPQRIIAQRSSADGSTEVFVKWTGLPYDECTWEKTDEPAIEKSSYLIDLFKRFETQAVEKDNFKDEVLRGKGEVTTLTEQPEELGGSLFPHQLEALNWLRKCWHRGKNVILADEMGLGKTISACAFLSSLYFEFKARLPSLVLVPLSTMPNWMSEFNMWAPNLNVVEYHGCARARALMRQYEWHANGTKNKKTSSYKFNVLLTTYEMVLADSSHLSGVPWEVLVVDEGHRLKNASSKLFSLLNTFSFQHRVLLTGTPLQNNIGEMYNLLNFLQPSSFPSLSAFEDRFNDLSTAEKVDELKKLVAPHMLRRLKKDAMQNIPPKTERIVPVELSSIQAEYYRAMLTKNYQVLRNIGKGIPQQSMLNIVMQLRKVCNHPYLITGTEPETGTVEFLHDMRIKASAKLTLLHSMLKILKKEGHRVLIFSQMTKLLDILEDYLNIEFGPKTFERVDGSVSIADRQMAIQRFNTDKSRFVFLLSTRSCGLGINLATADTVIIYDSDFNPHADIQAMNRAHRIGQSNRLLVYRLVVRASVEERILQLAKKKLMLDQLFVNKSGSQKEVEDILRWGTEQLFNDSSTQSGKDGENNENKGDESVITEHKSKRRTGGLGDVYQDKCTDGNSTIVWDESAILKLLDRSNLEHISSDNGEGDQENDMLGSVKSVDWNDESTEEQGGSEALVDVTDDATAQNLEKKDDHDSSGNVAEENEWDRLLRVRWEKYQSEEEAALGRGKRQRKAVSYREAYAPRPIETFENGGSEEPEPQPMREYTPAGLALKTKYSKLRARQKLRLAQMKAFKESLLNGGSDLMWISDQPTKENPSTEDNQTSKVQKRNFPTVLGLCAPNSTLMESSQKNASKSNKKNKHGKSLEFPFHLAPCSEAGTSTDVDAKPNGAIANRTSVPPFNPHVASESSGDGLPHSHEKMVLPRLPFDESFLSKLPFPVKNFGQHQVDYFPRLSLGRSTGGESSASLQDFLAIPFLPNFRLPQQEMEALTLPKMGLDQMPPSSSSLSENHRKVLENIMMRAGSGPGLGNAVNKRKPVQDFWSEEELDFLWIGVRRHGRGSWETMLRDPRLKFSRFRTWEDLAARWEEEQVKVLDIRPQKKSNGSKSSLKSPGFPNISDGMMKRALNRSRFAVGPPSFPPHLMDMKLALDGPSASMESPDQHGFQHDGFPPFPMRIPDRFRAGESSTERVIPNPFSIGSLDLNGLGGLDLQQKEVIHVNDRAKIPNFVDNASRSKNEVGASSASDNNKLPHWLREAVSVPAHQPQEPQLPPTVSAIEESVRLLYGDEKRTIPPFIAPGSLPLPPKDPRQNLKKKKKSSSSSNSSSHGVLHDQPSLEDKQVASTSGSKAAPPPEHLQSTSEPSWTEPDLNAPPPPPSPPVNQDMAVSPQLPSLNSDPDIATPMEMEPKQKESVSEGSGRGKSKLNPTTQDASSEETALDHGEGDGESC